MSDKTPALRLEGIVKTFPGVRALDGVDFKVEKGEFIAIFDADFLPAADWLKKTVIYFKDEEIYGAALRLTAL